MELYFTALDHKTLPPYPAPDHTSETKRSQVKSTSYDFDAADAKS